MKHFTEIRATRPIWATALITALAMIQLPGCGGGGGGGDSAPAANPVVSATIGPDGGSLTSGDNKMTLEVPAGALVTETEITIRPLGSVPQALSDLAPVVGPAYELEPDGAIFNQPVSVSLRLGDLDLAGLQPAGGTLVYSLLTLDANGAPEVLASGGTEASLTTGAVTVRGQTTHFSPLTVGLLFEAFEMELTGIADRYLVGTLFQGTVTAENLSSNLFYHVTGDETGSGTVIPFNLLDLVSLLDITLGPSDFIQRSPPYVCNAEGLGSAGVAAIATLTHPLLQTLSASVNLDKAVECVDPNGMHDISVTVAQDPAGHDPFIGLGSLQYLDVFVGGGELAVSGMSPWVDVAGLLADDGSFSVTGRGTVAGFANIGVALDGTLTADGLSANYTMGTDGGLPQALPIIYGIELRF